MPLKPQDAPCWVISYPDGTLAGQWDERHFADEDEAADVLDCEAQGADLADAGPRELPAACLTIVCDGCGEPHKSWPDDYLIGHFANASDAWADSSGVHFGKDGSTWCDDCAAKLPACHRCDEPVTGTPVTDPSDPLKRLYCSEGCSDAADEAGYEQRYPSGVAT